MKTIIIRRTKNLLNKNKIESFNQKNISSKTVYCYVDGQKKAEYESITRCAESLGMTRAQVRRAIEQSTVLENGFILSLT